MNASTKVTRETAVSRIRSCFASGLLDFVTRRGFLRAGSLKLGGLGTVDLLRLQAESAASESSPKKAAIMIFLGGGPPTPPERLFPTAEVESLSTIRRAVRRTRRAVCEFPKSTP